MNCKYCGAIVNSTDHFCGVCGKAIIPDSKTTVTPTSQFNNITGQPNISSFDNYNYNPNRYKPLNNAAEANKSNQIVFAHSIAISLLIVMFIIFAVVALIYYYSKPLNVVDVNNSTTSNVVVYQPTYSNTTTGNTIKSDSVFSSDNYYEVEYNLPNTFTARSGSAKNEKYYTKDNSGALMNVSIYTSSLTDVFQALNKVRI